MRTTQPLGWAHAVVTGGGTGIGLAIADELGRLGARSTLMGRSMARLEQGRDRLADGGTAAHLEPADVTDSDSVSHAFAAAVEVHGPVAILVNNAGSAESAPFRATDVVLWQRMLEVNLSGAYRCTSCVIESMLAQRSGRIVNVASIAGLRGYPYVTAYCAAKHGLLGFTINAVCPGYTDTDLVASSVDFIASRTRRPSSEVRATLERTNPSGRLLQPTVVASLTAWLCLPEAGMVTGQAIAVDGGELA